MMTERTDDWFDDSNTESRKDLAPIIDFLKQESFTTVDDDDKFDVETLKKGKFSDNLKLKSADSCYSVFYSSFAKPMDDLIITKVKELSSGSQGNVFCCTIQGLEGKFVDKNRYIYNNPDLASKALETMFGEFMLSKELNHPNIVNYLYFYDKSDSDTKSNEYHIITEMLEGNDMATYIKNHGRPSVPKIKAIGRQILSAIDYLHS